MPGKMCDEMGMDQQLHSTLVIARYRGTTCIYLSMLGLKLIHFSKSGTRHLSHSVCLMDVMRYILGFIWFMSLWWLLMTWRVFV